MDPITSVILYLAGGASAGALVLVVVRQMHRADMARVASEAEARARASEGELRTAAESARIHRELAESRAADLEERLGSTLGQLSSRDDDLRRASAELTRLRTEEAVFETRLAELGRTHDSLKQSFQALCGEALHANNEAFLQLARTELEKVRAASQADLEQKEQAIQSLVSPIREGLEKYELKLQEIERVRAETFGAIAQRLDIVSSASELLRAETGNLVTALRNPGVRGRWGEVQLKRVCELAGMLEHCDFSTQESVSAGDGRLRPDLIVKLVGGKSIVVDAKTPLDAYLEAMNASDEVARKRHLQHHARQVRQHVDSLSKKSYWEQFEDTPDMVVLFLPGESFYSAALEQDPGLIEYAIEQRVLLSTPTMLIALLRVFAYGWRQESLARNALEISQLGKDLHDRIATLGGHMAAVGKNLGNAVTSYNRAVGSMESRVLVQARRFRDLKAAPGEEIALLEPVESLPRELQVEELLLAEPEDGIGFDMRTGRIG